MSKHRFLFVDDEPMVLDGLRRMLRSCRNKWEVAFVESGAQALGLLEREPFDVIVSDMTMPGMNGTELLDEVRRRHPQMVRFILSAQADRKLLLQCVHCAHRFLAKPCEAEVLLSALEEATSLGFALNNEQLTALLSKMDRLPSRPAFCLALERRLASPHASIEDIGTLIAQDVSMAAQVLRLVNSAFFGLPQKIATPAEAVAFLGLEVVRALALSLHLGRQAKALGLPRPLIDGLWTHSQHVSTAAKLIAETEGAPSNVIQEASAAGLLHDAGKLILHLNFPDQMHDAIHTARAGSLSLCEVERRSFGCSHAEVGGYLFGLWGLPMSVVQAVALHHTPALDSGEGFSAVPAVHVANWLVHDLAIAPAEGQTPGLAREYLERLHLTDRLPVWTEVVQAKGF